MNDRVFLGLGSNLGDRAGSLSRALYAIEALDETSVLAVSNVVESEPWGVADQPMFANVVARIATGIPADRLLEALKEIETALGRERGERYGPRSIDIDLLLYGDEEWQAPDLVVPHPRLGERDFVVTPLLEIAPGVRWPDGTPVAREYATEGRVTRSIGPVPGFGDRTPPLVPVSGGQRHGDFTGEPWEAVASARFNVSGGLTYATELRFDASILEGEGIPIAWDPVPPAEEYNLYLMPRLYRLLVPASLAERARTILTEAHAGAMLYEDDTAPGDASGD